MEDFNEHTLYKMYEKYGYSQDKFLKEALLSLLSDKKQKYLIELNQLMRKYGVKNISELEQKIVEAKINAHPAWEELIETENIITELAQIDNDLRKLS